MANFYLDNKDLQYHLSHPLMKRIIELKERNFADAKLYDYAPQDCEDALDSYKRVLDIVGEVCGEVGASRAAVDAGFTEHERQIGQTGVTVRPKLYIACGISGQIQHTAGMDGSAMIMSINTDPEAPINKIADYAITGSVEEVIPKMIKYYKQNSK